MKKLPLYISVFLVLCVIFYWVFKLNPVKTDTNTGKETAVELSCDNGASMTAKFYEPDKDGIMTRLSLSVFKDGDTVLYDLYPSISASGAKFETKDQTHSLWEHQGTFTFAVDGVDIAVCGENQGQ
jgi:hypothetical protein